MSDLQLLSIPAAATLLDLSPKTLWQWTYAGQIASVKINGSRRIRLSTIQALIDSSEDAGFKKCKQGNTSSNPRGPGRQKGWRKDGSHKADKPAAVASSSRQEPSASKAQWVSGPCALDRL